MYSGTTEQFVSSISAFPAIYIVLLLCHTELSIPATRNTDKTPVKPSQHNVTHRNVNVAASSSSAGGASTSESQSQSVLKPSHSAFGSVDAADVISPFAEDLEDSVTSLEAFDDVDSNPLALGVLPEISDSNVSSCSSSESAYEEASVQRPSQTAQYVTCAPNIYASGSDYSASNRHRPNAQSMSRLQHELWGGASLQRANHSPQHAQLVRAPPPPPPPQSRGSSGSKREQRQLTEFEIMQKNNSRRIIDSVLLQERLCEMFMRRSLAARQPYGGSGPPQPPESASTSHARQHSLTMPKHDHRGVRR